MGHVPDRSVLMSQCLSWSLASARATLSFRHGTASHAIDIVSPSLGERARCRSMVLGRQVSKTIVPMPKGNRGAIFHRFRRSQRGVAALEFALVAPFLVLLLLGAFELTRYITAVRKITNMANMIAESVAQNQTGSVNSEDIVFFINSGVVDFPQLLQEAKLQGTTWNFIISITISSVYFTPTVFGCTSNCTYTAYPAFSGGGNQRQCFVQLTSVPDSAPSTTTTLPADVFGPGSLVVVDVTYSYRPRVATQLFGTLPIRRSFYIQPRYVPLIKYDFSDGWKAQACV